MNLIRVYKVEGKIVLYRDTPPSIMVLPTGDTTVLSTRGTRFLKQDYHKVQTRRIRLHGVGYKAVLKGQDLEITLGSKRPKLVRIPKSIEIEVKEKGTLISAKSVNVPELTTFSNYIELLEPAGKDRYTGKGIRRANSNNKAERTYGNVNGLMTRK